MSTLDQQEQPKENYKELAEEYKDHLQRLQAEFENYQKQIEKQKDIIKFEAKKEILAITIEGIDNMERALEHAKDPKAFKEGITLTHKHLLNQLKKQGIQQVKDKGKSFNINLHEIIAQRPGKETPGTIIEVIQTGYTFNGKPLRHSKVILAKEEEKNE